MAKTYEAMIKRESTTESGWRFLDLENKKQTGDLEKKIIFFHKKNDCKVFNFTCSLGNEGVSTIIANLMNNVAEKRSDKTFLVIDTNFHHPELHIIFNVSLETGLTDVLHGGINAQDAIQKTKAPNISILTSGSAFKEYAGKIEQEKLIEVVSGFRDHYDYVFVDSAPVLSSPDSLSSATASDLTFMVIQAFKVRREVAEKAKTVLADNECLIGGVVLNHTIQVIPGWLYKIL